jgi:hypothetical protein
MDQEFARHDKKKFYIAISDDGREIVRFDTGNCGDNYQFEPRQIIMFN